MQNKTTIKLLLAATLYVIATAPAAQARLKDGYYFAGHGSSHKYGKYRNEQTANHYKKRKKRQ